MTANHPLGSAENRQSDDWETPCPVSSDQVHCNHWYDGRICHLCGADGEDNE